MATIIQYQDIDILMKKDSNGDVSVKTNNDAINQSIGLIMNTSKGSQLWNPRFGSNIKTYLFEKVTFITAQMIKKDLSTALGNFEPRIRIVDILVIDEPDKYQYTINVNYEVVRLNTLASASVVIQVG